MNGAGWPSRAIAMLALALAPRAGWPGSPPWERPPARPAGMLDSRALRFRWAIAQGFDDTCAAASLAIFLRLFWGVSIDEAALLKIPALVRNDGAYAVSVAGLASALESFGFSCKAFRFDFEQLSAALARFGPSIIHYDSPTRHFAVAVGTVDDLIVVSDPASGFAALHRGLFESRWSGAALLAAKPGARHDAAAAALATSQAANLYSVMRRWARCVR
jgi:ABC-type bacteriocin/lantibiotic exporter with double-glycine peptidase domain